jgi:UDP-glucuronate 4-epimerase
MKYFVTGSAGFIGYHLAERLLASGHAVTGYDGITPYYDPRLKAERHARLARHADFTPVVAMLEDRPALDRAIDAVAPDIIVHLAAQPGVRYSLDFPEAYASSNVVGSLYVLEAARRVRPRHLLLASSSSIYGMLEDLPWREGDSTDQPASLYAATKKSMELMAHAYAHLHDVPTTAFRFFTVYGPWGRPDMALFRFFEAIAAGRPIELYGNGEMRRDFTYVDDLVEAVLRLADAIPSHDAPPVAGDTLSPIAPFRVVNIGSGRPVGLIEFVEVIERIVGRPVARRLMPMQPGDVPVTFAASDLLEALTGYRPATPLADGVRRFADWYAEYGQNLTSRDKAR